MPGAPPTKETKVRYRKKLSLWVTLGVIFFLFICNLFNFDLFQELENKTVDFRFTVRGARDPEAPVKIVAIDEKSLEKIGQWPWPRAVHAELVRKLKADGVKCVFYDAFFPEPERTQQKMLGQLEMALNSALQGSSRSSRSAKEKVLAEVRRFQETQNGDREFAKALKDVGNVLMPIIPFWGMESKEGKSPNPESLNFTEAELFGGFSTNFPPAETVIASIPEIQQSASDAGGIRVMPDPDGIIRYFPTAFCYRDKLIPHLSMQVARVLMGEKNPIRIYDGSHVLVGARKISVLSSNMAFINYCGKKGSFPTFSASDILDGNIEPGSLKGTAVLFGPTAAGINDMRATPFTKAMPGVEINANIIENVYSGNFISKAPEYWNLLLIVALAMLMWYLVPRMTPVQVTVWFFILVVAYIMIACIFFALFGIIINVTYPLVAFLLTYMFLQAYKFRTEVRYNRYLKNTFQSMVSPKVVEEILKMPAGIELGGEEKDLTVMFSDIRGFTTYSEKHSPKEVIGILNEYLTQMTDLLFQTDGTLDKYIGDAIMGFWGSPGMSQDHAYRACSTALGMVDVLHNVLHPKWEKEGKEKLQIGMGLNTGRMVVGFVGSKSIQNYTLIGDPVNLCSRLEGTTKEYKVEIIISETTYENVKNDMLCRELDLIQVKGKTQPIRIYELVDHRLRGVGMKEMKVKTFEEGLLLYRTQQWDEAVKRFKNCLELDPSDGPASIFLERCNVLKQNPPAKDWNGVFVMKTK